jgi:hypothetical protein
MEGHPEESHRLTINLRLKILDHKKSTKISFEREVMGKPAVEENCAECRQNVIFLV